MKKIFTFMAAALMAASAFAKTETVSSFDFLAWATEHLAEGNDGRKNLVADQFTAGDKFVGQTFYTVNKADTLPNPDFELFPNKEWTLTRVYSSGNLQIGIRATRNSEVKNMFGFKNMKQDMKVIVLSQSAALLASTEDVASVESEDVTVNFNYGAKDRSETAKKTTFTLLKDADLAIAFDKDNIIYSVEVTAEVDDSEYELQTLVEYSAGEVKAGTITAVGAAVLDQSAKYNSNGTSCIVISFPNSYASTKDDVTTYCYAEVSVEGGFKAGDSLTIQPFTAMSTKDFTGGSKYANIEFRAVTGEVEAAAVNLTGSTASSLTVTDGHEEAGAPKTFGYVFTADCDAFRLSRQGGTRINLLSMSVVRLVKKEDGGITTDLHSLEHAVKAVKMMENGQVVILRDGVKYNILGVRL